MKILENCILRDMTPDEEAYFTQEQERELLSYKDRVIARIREKYSIDDEMAILRQKDSKPEEFAEYYYYVEKIKEEEKLNET